MDTPAPATAAATLSAQRYLEVRHATERLCDGLSADDHMLQSMPEASPAKWHLAHTTWFYETFLLLPHAPGYRAFDERFTFVFNSYYKALEGHPDRARRGLFSRPTLDEVGVYRRQIDERMCRWIDAGVAPEVEPLLELGLHHEQQHQELIVTDLKHAFWSQPLQPAYRAGVTNAAATSAPPLRWIEFPGGVRSIGHDGPGFAFDNEGPRHDVLLRPFQIASRLITNAEFLDFIDDGGYRRPDLWLSDGWDAVHAQRWRAPLYWEQRDGHWFEFRCDGLRPLDPAAPVCHVSFYEADAYARWAGAHLASEFEWEIASASAAHDGVFLDDQRFHPAVLGGNEGLSQMFGDCWEWTASPYVAYPGFRPAAGALGEYNGKFMCNQVVLRGGSCATPRSHIRATYRNFFPPAARWQFSGIRLAR